MFHGGLDLYSTSAVCEGLSHDLYDYTVTVCSVNAYLPMSVPMPRFLHPVCLRAQLGLILSEFRDARSSQKIRMICLSSGEIIFGNKPVLRNARS